MPLAGFIHPLTLAKVGFDFLERDDSIDGRPCAPPWQARLCKAKDDDDIRHSGTALTATGATGCPREVFLKAHFDYWDRLDFRYPMDRGSALHAVSGKWWPANYITEESAGKAHRPFLTLNGTLFGTATSALVDTLRLERPPNAKLKEDPLNIRIVEILDSKFPSDNSVRFRGFNQGNAKPEYAVQLNQARLLLAQQQWALDAGYDPDNVDLTIWDHAYAKGDPPQPMIAPYMDEDEMMAVEPWSGLYSVEKIVMINMAMNEEYNALSAAERRKPDALREIASRIPLVGETMFGGKARKTGVKCSGCAVKEQCDQLRRDFGEPGSLV